MKINILHMIDGAKAARGIAVIIDVFRAFSTEAYLADAGARRIIPLGDIDASFEYKRAYPDTILCGEREGIMIEGFDYGNSPSAFEGKDLTGKTVVHNTSAGTQGIVNASGADEIIGGSLVCARPIAQYIKEKAPDEVSLVCMGLMARCRTEEDDLAALYIKSLLEGNEMPDIEERIARLKETSGAKFFVPELQHVFPRRDFELCARANAFDFVVRLKRDENGGPDYMEKVSVCLS